MKKRLGFLLVALLIVSVLMLTACKAKLVDTQFTAPTKTTYQVGESLNLSGSKITYVYSDDSKVEVPVTSAMLVSSTVPDFTAAGTFTVNGTHEGFDFSFTVTVEQPAPTYSFVAPTKLNYVVGDTLDLAGAQVVVDGTPVVVTTDMLDATTIPTFTAAGTFTVAGNYNGYAFSFTLTVEAPAVEPTYSFVAPTKLNYVVGEALDLAGAQVLVDGTPVAVTTDMLDASTVPAFDTAGTFAVTGSYQGYAFSFDVTVAAPAPSVYKTTFATADGSWTVTVDTEPGQVPVFPGREKYTKTMVYTDPTFDRELAPAAANETYVVTFTETPVLTVSQAKAKEIGDTVYVQGVVIAIINTGDKIELVVREDGTNNIIGFNQKLGLGTTSAMVWNVFEQGDRVVLGGVVTKYTASTTGQSGEMNKVYIKLTEDLEDGAPFIIEKNQNYALIHEQAVVIDSQEDLKALLEDQTVRGQNQYSYVKLSGPINLTPYYSSSTTFDTLYWRLWFGDITAAKEQRIDGTTCSPVFRNNNASANTGFSVSEMLFGETTMPTVKDQYTAPQVFNGDVYVIFVGGNKYYYQFAIVSTDDVVRHVSYNINVEGNTTPVVNETHGYVDYAVKTIEQLGWAVPQDHTFVGWSTKADGSGEMVEVGNAGKMFYGTLYAVWQVTGEDKITGVTATSPTATTKIGGAINLTGATLTVKHSIEAEETIAITEAMLGNYTLVPGANTITGNYMGFDFTITVNATNVWSVAEVKSAEVGANLVVRGIVMGVAEAPNASADNYTELILRDEATNAIIGIYGEALGLGTFSTLTLGAFKQGDVVELPASVVKYSTTYTYNGNYGKIYLQYTGTAEDVSSYIKESGKAYAIDPTLGGYETVTNQAELKDVLTNPNESGADRPIAGGQYKILKLSGTIYTTAYYTADTAENCEWWRIWFDPSISKLGEQAMFSYKPGKTTYNWSPSFRAINQDTNTGIATMETLFGCTMEETGKAYTSNFSFTGDIYAIWIGGNAYYAQLVIVSVDNVKATVTYNYNEEGSQVAAVTDSHAIAPTAVKTLEQLSWTIPEGKVFMGWNTKADGTGTTYTETIPANFGGNLYAIWASAETRTFVAPSKLRYDVGEALDLTGGQIAITKLGQTTNVAITAEMLKEAVDTTTAGTKVVTMVYEGTEYTYEITVVEPTVTFAEPTQTTFDVGERFNFVGATLTITYANKPQEVVDLTIEMLDAIPSTKMAGVVVVTGHYQGYEFTYEMEVRSYELSFVAPTKLSYSEGQVLSMEGAQIVYTYQDGTTKTIPATADMLDATTLPTMLEQGTFTVKGSFETLEFSFDVTVEVPTVSFVAPLKTVYKSAEDLDLTGAKIVYTFADGSTTEVAVAFTMLQPINPTLFTTDGFHTIRGSYKYYEFSFEIYVVGTNHTHVWKDQQTTAPTCTEQGYTTYTCLCDHVEKADFVSATGHRYSNLQVFTFCEEQGYILLGCGNCDGHWDSRDNGPETTEYLNSAVGQFIKLDPKGHTEKTLEAVAPTYNTTGWTEGKQCTVCNVITVAPTEVPMLHAFAKAGDVRYGTLEDAIAAAQAGEVVTLLDNIALNAPLVITKEIVLDLAGFEIVYTSTTQGEAMITNRGVLTINDSVGTGVINYNYVGAADSTYGKGNFTISNQATLTVNGGKITIATLRAHAKYPIDNNSGNGDAVLVINGGHLYNYNTSAVRMFCNSTTNVNSVTINGGLLEGYSAIWLQNPGKNTVTAQLTVNGGEVRTTAAAYVNGTATVSEVASKIYCTTEGGSWSEQSFVKLLGGTFNENVYLTEGAPANLVAGINATFNGRLELPVPHVHEYVAVVTAPTCTEQGYTTYTCECEDTYVADYVPATGHRYSNLQVFTFCEEQGYILLDCGSCGGHWDSRDNGPETTEYLASAVGQFIKLDPKGHKAGETVVENNVAATCTTDGSYDNVVYCSVCNKEISRETVTVPATGHRFSKTVVTPATCTTDGWVTFTCGNCNCEFDSRYDKEAQDYIESLKPFVNFDVAAKGHTEETIPAKEATCTETGLTAGVKCSVCDEVLTAPQQTPLADHTPGTPTQENVVPATCKAEGSYDEVVKCSECGEELSRTAKTIEKAGHTETTEGETTYCSVCGIYQVTVYYNVDGQTLSQTFDANANEQFTIPTLEQLGWAVAEGKFFVAFNSKDDATGTPYTAGEKYDLVANNVYVTWRNPYTFTTTFKTADDSWSATVDTVEGQLPVFPGRNKYTKTVVYTDPVFDRELTPAAGNETYVVTFTETPVLTVSQAKAAEIGSTVYVQGIVIAVINNADKVELLVREDGTNNIIGFNQKLGLGTTSVMKWNVFAVGDRVVLGGTLTQYVHTPAAGKESTKDMTGEAYKVYVKLTKDLEAGAPFIIEKDCDATLIKDQAVVIDSQDALKALLEDPIVRGQNQYTFVKLVGPINLTPYYGSSTTFDTLYWRLWFGDITGSSEQRIHGTTCSPVFRNNNASFNAGYTVSEMFFGETTMPTAKDLYTAPQVFNGTVYAIFVGGNIYYHQFAIIDADHVERTVTYDYNVEGSSVAAVSDTRSYVDYTVKTVDQLGWAVPADKVFAGWNTKADGTGTMVNVGDVDKYLTGNLYAIWADDATDRITGVETTSNPTNDTIKLYDTLDLTGATITVKHSKQDDEVIAVTAQMLGSYTLVKGVNQITGTYEGYEFVLEVIVSDVYSVAEAKKFETDTTFTVRGIVMGVAEANNSASLVELLLRDENSNAIIGIYGANLGLGTNTALSWGVFAQGDVVELPAKVVVAAGANTSANHGKLWLSYTGTAEETSNCIKEHGKAYNFDTTDTSTITTITTQAELRAALTEYNAEADKQRMVADQQYRIFKFSGTIYGSSYYSTSTPTDCEFWRFWMGSKEIVYNDPNGQILFNGGNPCSPVFRNNNNTFNMGESFRKVVFGQSKASSSNKNNWTGNINFTGDIYAIFIGGSGWYAQFVIVSMDNIVVDVTYDYNVEGSEVQDVVAKRKFSDTTVSTIDQLGWTAPSGYKFVGWNTAADGTGNSYTTLPTNFAGTLYAVWEEEQLAHEHTPGTAVVENSTPATCKAAGSYDEVVYCSECGEELSRTAKTIEKLAHTPGEWVITTEPTHLAVGAKEQKCTVCSEVVATEEMPVVTVTFVAPTKVDGYALLDIIDVAGGSITFNYTHKEPVTVALTAEMLSEYALAAGDNTITVTYEGYTTTFVVKAATIPFTLSQAKALWETNPDKITANGVKGYIAAFDTPSDSGTTVSGVYLTDEQTVYLISFSSVQLEDLTYKVSDEVVVSNAALDHTNGGRVLTGTIQSVTATDKKLDLSAIQPDVVITTQDEMTAWAKETVPAKGLIVKFEGLFSFVGTNKTGQGQGTRLNLNYAEAAEFGTADYTWKASENKTKTLSFKYGSNNLLLEKWWQVVGGRDDDESKKCLPCGGSFVAISGGFGATLWSWNIFDADRFDAHVRTAVEWAPKEVPTLLEETLDAILGKHVLASSTTHVSGINWTLAEAVDGITVENNTITLRDATLDGTTIKLTATVDTYTVTVERKVLWVNPPAATVTQALAAEADTVISVEGLFVGVADEGNGYQKEILLKDPANDNLIAVQGTNYGEWPTVGYTKGDLVRLVVNVKHKATGNKTYLEFIEGNNPTNVAETIVSSGNAVTYNLDNVVTLENWDAWKTTFVVDTLPMYTYIRIKGTVYLNKLNSTSSASGGVTLYRPHMNPAPTNLTGMKPDGTRAIGFRENVLKANLGSTTWSTYFSGKTWSTSYTFTDTKYQKEVDIIAVYTNANGVNFMLTILEADWLK